MNRILSACLLSVGLFASEASAITIDLGSHALLAGTPGQSIDLYAEGSEVLVGMELFLSFQPSDRLTPKIVQLDTNFPGMFFEGSLETGEYVADHQMWFTHLVVNRGDERILDGRVLIGRAVIDTSEIQSFETFQLSVQMTHVDNAQSYFLNTEPDRNPALPTQTNGLVTVGPALPAVPEPSTGALAVASAGSILGLSCFARRRSFAHDRH